MRVALKFAYNGKNFYGYARQPKYRTIEQNLLDLLIEQRIINDTKTAFFRTASRTDRSVSALGNVCSFDTDKIVTKKTILELLTNKISDVYIYGVQFVKPDFYPRHAIRREYRYYLKRDNLDFDTLLSTAALFTGKHNFRNFARIEPMKNPVRTIDHIIIEEKKDFLIFDFYAQTFLWNQIRRIMSALEKRGKKVLSKEQIFAALEHPQKKVDFQIADPEPLILKNVMYNISFEYLSNYKKNLQILEKEIVESL